MRPARSVAGLSTMALKCGPMLTDGREHWLRSYSVLRRPPMRLTRLIVRRIARGPALTRAGRNEVRTFTVTLLEKLANSLLALSWHDPTLCNYEEQIWAPGLAQKSGSCALSGLHISRGDRIYRLRTRGKMAPLNGNAMILASALPQTKED